MTDRPEPAVPTCHGCGERYFPQAEAWGASCGACIAARLELGLLRAALGGDTGRRPMRRAASTGHEAERRRRA